MDRAKISIKRRKSSKGISKKGTSKIELKTREGLRSYSPTEQLLDEDFIAKAVWECFKNNDPEGVVDVIQAHMKAVNKTKAARENNLPKSSMYNAFKGKNPTVKTLAKLVHCCA